MNSPHLFVALASLLIPVLLSAVFARAASAPPLSMLHADGTRVVDADGRPVVLRGCNLGNWLVIETWMLDLSKEAADQAEIRRIFTERFGADEAQRLLELYRAGYITDRDFDEIAKFHFNLIRLPFEYSILQSDEPPYDLKPDPFHWLDRAVEMAERHGMFVILDLHGAPGRQSKEHHTGQAGVNQLFAHSDAGRTFRDRTAKLWRAIAEHYRDRPTIAAYDLLNEPWGDYKTDLRDDLRQLTPRLVDAIRATGDKHIVLLPGMLGHGVTFYGDVIKQRGWTNVGFTDHYYPGLFGSPKTLESHANLLMRTMPEVQRFLDQQRAPFLVGEFNVVSDTVGGSPMMRRYYDEFARRGFMATMWSYKILNPRGGVHPDNWYLITNAQPIPRLRLKEDSKEQIEMFLRSLADMPLAVDEELRNALTAPVAPRMDLPPLESRGGTSKATTTP
jgi:endoglucanase